MKCLVTEDESDTSRYVGNDRFRSSNATRLALDAALVAIATICSALVAAAAFSAEPGGLSSDELSEVIVRARKMTPLLPDAASARRQAYCR